MSSSRQSSPTEDRTRPGPCPTCGSPRVAKVSEDVQLRISGKTHRFASVAHERCLACGERVFGIDASRLFDAAVLRRRGRRAA
jgi:YgiT-type zinc finger domain-containing protein